MSTFMSLQMEDDPDIIMKAPYISMNTCEDLPLLMSPDIMWNTNDKKSNGGNNSSSLAQLLCSSVKQIKNTDHGGGLLQTDQMMDDIYNEKSKFWKGIEEMQQN